MLKSFNGKTPRIAKSACVDEAAHIIGDVEIGDNVTIGHGAVVNCHRIGNNVLVGMNATILHKAEIGNNCIIGAATLVVEGMKIPDNSFVASVPGKIRGKSTEKQLWWIKREPETYPKFVKQYKAGKLERTAYPSLRPTTWANE